jgi:hypothetical protein
MRQSEKRSHNMTRWLFSTNTKAIGTLSLMFVVFSGILCTAFFVLILLGFYNESTVCEFSIFSGLGISSLIPVKPGDDKPRWLTKKEKGQFTLPSELKNILIGLSLGDLYIYKQCANASFTVRQGIIHEKYLLHLFDLFKDFCPAGPKIQNHLPDKRTSKVYSAIYFRTYALPCFNGLHELFYVEGKKIVPLNIKELLTPVGLCYLLCDDGYWNSQNLRVVLCTNSFTLEEVHLLADALNKNWDLKCYVNKHTSGYIIIIPPYSVPILQDLLKDTMPPMMLYKIGL